MESTNSGPVGPVEGESVRRRADQDDVLVEALAQGLDYAAAGELAHLSARTVRRRMARPSFAALVQQRRGQRVGELTGVLVGLAERAVATLRECMDADRPGDRIRAAQVVLGELHRFRDQCDVEDRLRQLEQAAFGDGDLEVDGE